MRDHELNGSEPCVVLHIEDDDASRRVVQEALELRADIKLVAASRGKLGLELACVHRPTVVLLNMGLPDMKGDIVLDCLRADPFTRTASVIVMSSEPPQGHIQRLVQTGRLTYVAKPFASSDLIDAIDKLLIAQEPQPGPNLYGAFLPLLIPAVMTPSSVVSDLMHAMVDATTRAAEHAHGLFDFLLPL